MGTKITRKTQKVFASTAGGSGVAEFGSTAAGSTVFTTDLAVIQSTEFEEGLAGGIIAGSKRLPVYEEMNGVYYTTTKQLAYLFENGIPEWDAGTEYFITSIVRKTNTYELYGSVGNNNIGNALPSAVTDANWTYLGVLTNLAGTGTALTGDVTGSGTGSIATTIANNAVSAGKIASNAVTTAKIADNNVTLAKMATQAANTVLVEATGTTAVPAALAMGASTILARLASGNIVAATPAQLNALLTAQNLASSGYMSFIGGLKINWGVSGSIGAVGSAAQTFNSAFSTACYGVYFTRSNSSTGGQAADFSSSVSTSGFTINNQGGTSATYYWFAIGQ